jgi:hypothetical protein
MNDNPKKVRLELSLIDVACAVLSAFFGTALGPFAGDSGRYS